MENLSFGTIFTGQRLEIKISWMNAFYTGLIVPEISFGILALTF